ncbi:MAG: substrate-binding domain-containing protein [Verrucomicrobiae bacterium]|nr:substrate-binding domain-containing protein [Verrucomicrobiae bacterium]
MKKCSHSVVLKWAGAVGCAFALIQSAPAQTVRLHGAVGFAKVIESQKAAIESAAGAKLEVVGNGSGRGLADLINGQADITLVAGPLKALAEVMNKEKAGSADISQMKEILVMTSRTIIAANPSAGVKSLTDAQVSAVFTGKATNWKEVGGADVPIKVVLPFSGDGSRIMVQGTFFPGVDFVKDAIVRNSAKDLCVVVDQLPGACTMTAKQNITGNVITVATEKDILIPWSFVVKGEPAGDVKKVVEAATALIK